MGAGIQEVKSRKLGAQDEMHCIKGRKGFSWEHGHWKQKGTNGE